jgi:hypothetical protein
MQEYYTVVLGEEALCKDDLAIHVKGLVQFVADCAVVEASRLGVDRVDTTELRLRNRHLAIQIARPIYTMIRRNKQTK